MLRWILISSLILVHLTSSVKSWAALKVEQRQILPVHQGQSVKLTCISIFTSIDKGRTNKNMATIAWNDVTVGNRVYFYDKVVEQQTKGYEVENDFSKADRIRSVFTVRNLQLLGKNTYECQFRRKINLNQVLYHEFDVQVIPKPSPTTPTTTSSPSKIENESFEGPKSEYAILSSEDHDQDHARSSKDEMQMKVWESQLELDALWKKEHKLRMLVLKKRLEKLNSKSG